MIYYFLLIIVIIFYISLTWSWSATMVEGISQWSYHLLSFKLSYDSKSSIIKRVYMYSNNCLFKKCHINYMFSLYMYLIRFLLSATLGLYLCCWNSSIFITLSTLHSSPPPPWKWRWTFIFRWWTFIYFWWKFPSVLVLPFIRNRWKFISTRWKFISTLRWRSNFQVEIWVHSLINLAKESHGEIRIYHSEYSIWNSKP